MHHRTPVRQRGRCGQVLARAFAQLIQRGEDNLIGVGIFALRVIEHVEAVKQLVELLVDFAKRQRPVNAQLRRRGLLAQAAAKPDFGRQVALWLWVSLLLISTSTASGSLKPVKYQKSLLWR